jgi:sporulation protein YlmC with PRC-barrel domain
MNNNSQFLGTISSLLNHRIITAEGKLVGHVADVVLTEEAPYRITGLLYGESGWEHRLHLLNPFSKVKHSQTKPYILSWDDVERVERSTIVLKQNSCEPS